LLDAISAAQARRLLGPQDADAKAKMQEDMQKKLKESLKTFQLDVKHKVNDQELTTFLRWRSTNEMRMVTPKVLTFLIEELLFKPKKKMTPSNAHKGTTLLLDEMKKTCPSWLIRDDVVGNDMSKRAFRSFAFQFLSIIGCAMEDEDAE
jgi:hypothetical protein